MMVPGHYTGRDGMSSTSTIEATLRGAAYFPSFHDFRVFNMVTEQ